MKKYLLIIIFLILISFTIIYGQANQVRVVKFAQFEHFLKANPDTVYIINFWATWCGPCRKELPDLEKIHRQFSGQKVKVLLVSLDFPDQLNKGLAQFIKANDITAQVVLLNDPDANAWIDKVNLNWSGSLPATLIYKGKDRLFFEKELSYQEINQTIVSLKP